MSPKTSRPSPGLPILHVDEGRIEWLARPWQADPGYATADVDEASARDVAAAAAVLARATRRRPGRCALVLGGRTVKQRIVQMGDIPQKELRGALLRKAANLLGTEPEAVFFNASPMSAEEGGAGRRWLIQAILRAELEAGLHELRRAGFKPERVVAARQALLGPAVRRRSASAAAKAVIVVAIELHGIAISLVDEELLVQQTVVPGNFERQPHLAAAVVQELRGFESYWRKVSRGRAIDHVALVGLHANAGQALGPAIHAALPGCTFGVVESTATDSPTRDRPGYLAACSEGASVRSDLTPPTPPRRVLIGAAAALALLAGCFGGMEVMRELRAGSAWRLTKARVQNAQGSDLEYVQGRIARVERARKAFEARAVQVATVGRSGRALVPMLTDIGRAFGDSARLESINVEEFDGVTRATFTGRADSDPLRSLETLEQLVASIEDSAYFQNASLAPPSSMRSERERSEELSFTVDAVLEEGQ